MDDSQSSNMLHNMSLQSTAVTDQTKLNWLSQFLSLYVFHNRVSHINAEHVHSTIRNMWIKIQQMQLYVDIYLLQS